MGNNSLCRVKNIDTQVINTNRHKEAREAEVKKEIEWHLSHQDHNVWGVTFL